MSDDIKFLTDYCQKHRFRLMVNYHHNRIVVDGAWFPSASKAVAAIRRADVCLPGFMKPVEEEYEELLPEGDDDAAVIQSFKFVPTITDVGEDMPLKGVVSIVWEDDDDQPVATINMSTGRVIGVLVDVPDTLRALIKSGTFTAIYWAGVVAISAGPIE